MIKNKVYFKYDAHIVELDSYILKVFDYETDKYLGSMIVKHGVSIPTARLWFCTKCGYVDCTELKDGGI